MTIPEEAVQRAHAAICEESLEDCLDPDWRGRCVKAVEAAAPFLRAKALEDAAKELAQRAQNVRHNTHIESEMFVALTFRAEVLDDAAELVRACAVTERGGE